LLRKKPESRAPASSAFSPFTTSTRWFSLASLQSS